MEMPTISSRVKELDDEFDVINVEDEGLLTRIFELRYQIYCTERGFLPGHRGLECDEFDHKSRHIALINRQSGEMLGTARLVLPLCHAATPRFPMQLACDPRVLVDLPMATSTEVSRFAISKHRRPTTAGLMRMALIKGLIRLSGELGITHWCAVMEPTLLRLLRMTSIYFHPLGPLVDYHGLRQPCFNRLDLLLEALYAERPALWDYLTEGSEIWRQKIDRRVAA